MKRGALHILKLDYDVTKPTLKYAESLWFNYRKMLIKMRDIELDVDKQADDNEGIKAQGSTSNPTEKAAMRIFYLMENDKQYQTLANNVKVVEYIYNSLPDDYKSIARSRYFMGSAKKWDKIAMETGYSVRQAIRIRNMMIVATAERLNLW